MAGIVNINGNYNINLNNKIKGKISFEIGQVFAARMVSLEETGQDVLLKLLDGWELSAKLEKPLDNALNELIKFKVEGLEDGKIKLKIVNEETQGQKEVLQDDSLEKLLKSENLNVKKEYYGLLKDMIKHNIPLTKENITNVISIKNFGENVSNDKSYVDTFINKYLLSKNINPNSVEGKNIAGILKEFFNKLVDLKPEEIMTFLENDIELSSDNIDSFKNVFKEQGKSIYNIFNKFNEDNIAKEGLKDSLMLREFINTSKVLGNNLDELNNIKENNVKNSNVLVLEKDTTKAQINNLRTEEQEIIKEGLNNKGLELKDKDIGAMSNAIKEEINVKTEEIKNIISSLLKNIKEGEGNLSSDGRVASFLKEHINDFKVFNSVSNQYYYMDVPINVDNNEYECKLMIKDERGKGKKIDSKNVKIAASINTKNMGEVDAFISVNNTIIDINIKSYGEFINILKDSSKKVLDSLSNLNYNIHITVDKKEEKFDIINCRDFFNDDFLGNVDARV